LAGDKIVSIDADRVWNWSDFIQLTFRLRDKPRGTPVRLGVLRRGIPTTVRLTVGDLVP
jgi:hypothetical protein